MNANTSVRCDSRCNILYVPGFLKRFFKRAPFSSSTFSCDLNNFSISIKIFYTMPTFSIGARFLVIKVL